MIIGIAGRAGTGKDTVAGLIQKLRPNVQLVSLAGPIKEFAKQVFEFSDEQLYGPSEYRDAIDPRYVGDKLPADTAMRLITCGYDFAVNVLGNKGDRPYLTEWFHGLQLPLTPRHVLQTLGTEVGRAINPDVWVNHMLEKTRAPDVLYVCTDVRFENEMRAIRKAGQLWWLTRPGAGLKGEAGIHSSERDLDRLDLCEELATVTYHNDGSLEDLENFVRSALCLL